MALFSSKKKTVTKAASKKAAARPAAAVRDTRGRLEGVLKAPWLSEKALIGTEKGIYVFAIPQEATKKDVADAVQKIYGVTAVKVTVTNLPGKRKALRHKRGFGTRAKRRKASVHLKKGESITFA